MKPYIQKSKCFSISFFRYCLSFFSFSCLFSLLIGCQFFNWNSHPGQIQLSYPQVFSRERLVEDRVREVQWLKNQFEQYAETTQGYIDTSSFVGFAAGLQADFKPLEGHLKDVRIGDEVAAMRRKGEIEQLNHEKMLLLLEQEINQIKIDLKNNRLTIPRNKENSNSPTSNGDPEGLRALESELGQLKKDLLENKGKLDQVQINSPKAESLSVSSAKITSTERLADQKSYRDSVAALLREKQLDDTHDIKGFTLYELKFDVSYFPENIDAEPIKLELEAFIPDPIPESVQKLDQIEKDETKDRDVKGTSYVRILDQVIDQFYNAWIHALRRELAREAYSMQRNFDYDVNPLELSEIQDVFFKEYIYLKKLLNEAKRQGEVSKAHNNSSENTGFLEKYSKGIKTKLEWLDKSCSLPLAKPTESDKRKRRYSIACFIQIKYEHLLRNYTTDGPPFAEILQPIPMSIINQDEKEDIFWIPGVKGGTEQIKLTWWESLRNSTGNSAIVMSVEPKNYMQNISEVAARENLLNLVLGLKAMIPNGISGDIYAQHIRRSQELIQALGRKPIVVGFSNGPRFGWIMGPRFSIENEEPTYAFEPITHSFTVTIKAPAWAPAICITAKYGPYTSTGSSSTEHKYVPGFSKISDENLPVWLDTKLVCPDGGVRIPLVPDSASVTTALFSSTDRVGRSPRIYYPQRGTELLWNLSTGGEERIIITGRDLWRNPKVFLGNYPAIKVDVLPDMAGLEAVFKGPILENGASGEMRLMVVTTFGEAEIPVCLRNLPDVRLNRLVKDCSRILNQTHENSKESTVSDRFPTTTQTK